MALRVSRLVGHRGVAAEAPENTLTGFRKAAEAGFGWVEFDVMLSSDDVPILHHDESLGRTNNGTGSVAATSAKALRRLDAGSWFGQDYAGERIPTLEDTISCCRALGLGMNVEIKPTRGRAERTAEIVCGVLTERCGDLTDRIVVSSFAPDCLRIAQEKAPDFPRGYLCEVVGSDWRSAVERYGCVSVHPNHGKLDQKTVAEIRDAGYAVLTYTVNEPERAVALIAWGVDAVITDELSVAAALA